MTRTLLSLLLVSCVATVAFGQATIGECEKIQAADAYNQCLAKFGPPAKGGNLEPERPGDVKAGPAEAAASAGPARGGRSAGRHRGRGAIVARHGRGRHGGRIAHAGGGRKRMTISVGK